jgi:hypothetical protein
MFLMLLFTVLGFLSGLAYVMARRKIRPGNILAAAFLGLLTAGIGKIFRDNLKNKSKRRHF